MTEQDEYRVPMRPLQSIPPIADTAIDPSGELAVEVEDLCDRAGIRYRVTGGFPPLVVLRECGGHERGRLREGRECFVVDVSDLPTEDPERSMRVLELLVRGFGCYQAEKSLCARGYFSPDIVTTYSGRVIIEGDDE
jgi:hypothetical protein